MWNCGMYHVVLPDGRAAEIANYACRPTGAPHHHACRVWPTGEEAVKLEGKGRYRWRNKATGEWLQSGETFRAGKCELAGCEREGKNGWFSGKPRAYPVKGANGQRTVAIRVVICKLQNPSRALHTWYLGPHGERCTKVLTDGGRPKHGCYSYRDSVTGEVIETEASHARAIGSREMRAVLSKAQRRFIKNSPERAKDRAQKLTEYNQSPQGRNRKSEFMRERARDPNYIEQQRQATLTSWQDPKVAKRRIMGTRRAFRNDPGISARAGLALKATWAKRKAELQELRNLAAAPRGRPRGEDTEKKLELMARLSVDGKSLRAMSLDIYPERKSSPAAAYANVRWLASHYRSEFEAAKQRLLGM
jgi:hypothetical protein